MVTLFIYNVFLFFVQCSLAAEPRERSVGSGENKRWYYQSRVPYSLLSLTGPRRHFFDLAFAFHQIRAQPVPGIRRTLFSGNPRDLHRKKIIPTFGQGLNVLRGHGNHAESHNVRMWVSDHTHPQPRPHAACLLISDAT